MQVVQRKLAALTLIMLGLGIAISAGAPSVQASSFLSGTYTNAAGTRPYKLFVPTSYTGRAAVPLVVVLHGCSQNPDNIATGSRFNDLAEQYGFLALYPQQLSDYNASKCWNWFETSHQTRGQGEPSIIAGMVDYVRANYRVDINRNFVTGMSAGGAMSSIMAACYPDYFAAAGVHSGIQYKGGTDLPTGLLAQQTGGTDPDTNGGLAYLCGGAAARVTPVIVFHGTLDQTVNQVNAENIIRQFAQSNDYADDRTDNNSIQAVPTATYQDQVPGGRAYTVSNYQYNGQLLLQKYMVEGMTHAWSGGNSAAPATYVDSTGPNAGAIMWDFFMAHPKKRK